MKKYFYLSLCFFALSIFACSDDMNNEEEEEQEMMEDLCEGTSYTYEADIKSIVDSNCAISGCHNGSGSIPDFSTYDELFDNRLAVKSRTGAKTMPPASSDKILTDAQIQMIACWVDDGAPQ